MAYREFRNEETYEAPEEPGNGWVMQAMSIAAQKDIFEKRRKDEKAAKEQAELRAFDGATPYPEDTKEVAEKALKVISETAKAGQISPEQRIAMREAQNHVLIARSQKAKQDELQQAIDKQDDFFDKGLANERLSKANEGTIRDRDKHLNVDFNSPEFFKKDHADSSFLDQFKNNGVTRTKIYESKGFVTTENKRSIKKPFVIEDKTKVLGVDESGNPIHPVTPGVSDDHIDQFLNPEDKIGARRLSWYASKIDDKEITARIKAAGKEDTPVIRQVAKEAIIREKAKADLEKMNIGTDDFTISTKREKPASDGGSGNKEEKERPIMQDDVIHKATVSQQVKKTTAGGTIITHVGPDGKEGNKPVVRDEYIPREYVFGKDKNNANPAVSVRSTMYSISENKEIPDDGSPKDVEITSTTLQPVNKKTGKLLAFKSKEELEAYKKKNPGTVGFEWFAVGNLKSKSGNGKEVEKGVKIPLNKSGLRQQVDARLKSQYNFSLEDRTNDELHPYEKESEVEKKKVSLREKYKY